MTALVATSSAVVACFVGIDEGLLARDGGSGSSSGSGGGSDGGDGGAPDTGPARVPCGSTSCEPPVSVCCADSFGDTDYRKGACFTRDKCPTGDYFACTAPHDCAYPGSAGPRCCIVRLSGGAWTQSVCAAECDGGDALCADGDGVGCVAGLACRASLEFPALEQCQK